MRFHPWAPRPLSPAHAAIVDALTEGIGDDDPWRGYDKSPDTRPVYVEIVGPGRFPVTRYGRAGGVRVHDPDVELLRTPGGWIPLSYDQGGRCRIAVAADDDGRLKWATPYADTITAVVETFLDEVRATQWPLTPITKEAIGR